MTKRENIIFKTASPGPKVPGYRMVQRTSMGNIIRVLVRSVDRRNFQKFPVETDKWMHVAFSWHP